MNNAIKYAICAGASLALGFGAGYFFKGAQDNINTMQRQAEFEASAVSYASEGFKQINSDLYSAHQSANNIERSLEESRKALRETNDLLRSASPIVPHVPAMPGFGQEGSEKVDGLDDLFKDKEEGEKK